MNYLDTSALIKRFVAERGSPLIQTIVTRNGTVATANRKHASACRQFEGPLGEEITFAAADERLLRAAEAEDLRTLNVEAPHAP